MIKRIWERVKQSKILVIGVILGIILMFSALNIMNRRNQEVINKTLEDIRNICNEVYHDIEGKEELYLGEIEKEEDALKRGMYASALVQINSFKGSYDGVLKYSKIAIENYEMVKNGKVYALDEMKYLAWASFKFGKYSISYDIVKDIESMDIKKYLSKDDLLDAEVMMNIILLNIYLEYGLIEEGKPYYEELCKVEYTEDLYYSRGEKIAYSKMLYAMKIEDYNLMTKYAYECYEISKLLDVKRGVETSTAMIINCAYANIYNGNLEKGLEETKIAEAYFEKRKEKHALVDIYHIYGVYYSKILDREKTREYYEKSISLANEFKDDVRLVQLISEYIEFCEENNILEGLGEYKKQYYELTSDNNIDKEFKAILEKTFNENEKLNDSIRGEQYQNILKHKKINVFYKIVLIALLLLMGTLIIIIKRKNMDRVNIEKMANIDFLTKVNTRANGYRLIGKLVKNNVKFSLAILDIDDFKLINDTYGHMFGDEVLFKLGQVLKRKVGKEDIIIRFGGEEFIVIFSKCCKIKSKWIMDDIRNEFLRTKFSKSVKVSFSCGIEEWDNSYIDNVIDKADSILYKAKKDGKNRVYIK